jgi:glycosyltransferase involved in cell wall biosynthesis
MTQSFSVAILFSDFGPYHVARIEALHEACLDYSIQLFAFRFTERSSGYGWNPETPKGVPVITLANFNSNYSFKAFRIAVNFWLQLKFYRIDVVLLPSYSPLPNLLCFIAAKLARCRTVLMLDSWDGTDTASLGLRSIKHILVRMFDSALVAGKPHRDYVVSYGISSKNTFTGYDVIDVDFFSSRAQEFSVSQTMSLGMHDTLGLYLQANDLKAQLLSSLPKRFFLSLGRFVEKKNLSTLVAAYARFLQISINKSFNIRPSLPSLVFVGEGPLRDSLVRQALDFGLSVRDWQEDHNPSGGPEVVFYPFLQADSTPLFFSRCEAFILPSLYEEWGLVVNEAMACSAPVIVSNRVGSHFDLVQEGVNGFTFDPLSFIRLSELLLLFEKDDALRSQLGEAGRHIIEDWKPSRFGSSGVAAIRAALHG